MDAVKMQTDTEKPRVNRLTQVIENFKRSQLRSACTSEGCAFQVDSVLVETWPEDGC